MKFECVLDPQAKASVNERLNESQAGTRPKQSKTLRSTKRTTIHDVQLLTAIAVWYLFQKNLTSKDLPETTEEIEEVTEFSGIRCPLCHWQPRPSSRWCCADCDAPEFFFSGCGMVWNTFETRGICPGCQHQWQWTTCLACWGWSLHEDWYVDQENSQA